MSKQREPQFPTALFEELEPRLLLNGNVLAAVSGKGNLKITGDAGPNQIEVTQLGAGQFEVTGLAGTRVNGAGSALFSGVTRQLLVNLGRGDDVLVLNDVYSGIPGVISGGRGTDGLQMIGSEFVGEVKNFENCGPSTAPLDSTVEANPVKHTDLFAPVAVQESTAAPDNTLSGYPASYDLLGYSASYDLLGYSASYDLRNVGGTNYVTSVKNQNPYGTCWTFATYGSLESSILKAGGATTDFSERNLAYRHGFDWGWNDGGNSWISEAYLSRFSGPINESDDPYSNMGTPDSVTGPVQDYVREMLRFDTDSEIKNAIMTYGALYTSMYWTDASYRSSDYTYYYSGTGGNHAVTIVGWDDNKATAGGTGAWLIKNSWGSGWGNGGYFWLAYQDSQGGNSAESFGSAVPASNYSKVYYWDDFGDVNELNTPYGFNKYTASTNSLLKSVGFFTQADSASYTVRIYDTYSGGSLSSQLASTSGTMTYAGWHTIDLTTPVSLSAGNDFYVYLNITGGGTYPMAFDYYYAGYTSASTASPGQSYYSFNGTSWTDLTTWNSTANFCIKALVAVNNAPTLTAVSTLTGATEDTAFPITYATLAAAADETDVDGDPISFRIESVSTGTLTKGGVAVVPGTTLLAAGESLVWTPAANANGTLNAFTVKAWDGSLASSTAVQVQVNTAAANDAPVFTSTATPNVAENTTAVVTVNATDADLPAQTVTYSITGGVDAAKFNIVGATGVLTFITAPDFEVPTDANADNVYNVTVTADDGAGGTTAQNLSVTVTNVQEATVVGRRIFYNRSYFDGNNAAANTSDDNAIAPSPAECSNPALGKQALLPGQTATFQNYTSYSRGINGIMVDLAGLENPAGLTAADFAFKVGNSNTPATWVAAPAPASVTVRQGAGPNGSDRVTIIWADNAIQKEWLQVTVLATANTGLANPDVFYWGNAPGESGNSTANAIVNSSDDTGARQNPHTPLDRATVCDPYDFNRDGLVNSSDQVIARNNATTPLTALKLITVPSG